MHAPALNLAVPLAILLLLLAILVLAGFAIHRWLRRHAPPAAVSPLAGATRVPFATLEQMVVQIKNQADELERLRRELKRRDQDSMRLSRELLGHLPSGVIFFDRAAVVQEANPAARAALGFASPQGLRASELFRDAMVREQTGERLGPAVALIAAAQASGAPLQRKEMDYVTPQGQRRILGLTLAPIRRPAADTERTGSLDGLLCLLTDLTAIRALEDELRRRHNLASLGEMAAGIAHEFKNALATISGYAQMLSKALAAESPAGGGEELRDYSGKIVEQAAALTEMIGEFLMFARPLDARLEPMPLAAALDEARRALDGPEFAAIAIERSGASPQVMGDRLLLTRVWINLLRNACEAILQAGKGGRVAVIVEEDGDRARVRIADNGPGIPPEAADKIFIPFFTTKPTGSGMGLAVVHKVVAAHRGAVWLEENSAAGVTFLVTLPLAAAARASGALS